MIFTSCHHVCPTTTKYLDGAVRAAREVLGKESFEVVTIGFDAAHDTPSAMRAFARQQGIDASGWRFLSGTPETIEALSEDLGFISFVSPRGFDHINQTTIIDREGVVYSQVYGVKFELPWLVEPLKQLVFNRLDPSVERLSVVLRQYGKRLLRNDWTVVNLLVDKVDGDASGRDPVLECVFDGTCTGKRRQKRRMDVDDRMRKSLDRLR